MSSAEILMSLQDRVINQEVMATPEMITRLMGNSTLINDKELCDVLVDSNTSGVVPAGNSTNVLRNKECTSDERRLRARKTANG